MLTPLTNNSISLLRAYVAWMVVVAMLFLVIVLGIYIYATDALTREKALVSTLLPELDTVYQLTAATSALESQSLRLSSAEDEAALNLLGRQLQLSTESAQQAIQKLSLVEFQDKGSVATSIREITLLANELADLRNLQFINQKLLDEEKTRLLQILAVLESTVQSQVVLFTEEMLTSTDTLTASGASDIENTRSTEVENEVAEFERLSLAIQDLLLVGNDIVSLMAVVERVPLLVDVPSVLVAAQTRDLLLNALVNQSIYISFDKSTDSLLIPLRKLRTRLTQADNLFATKEQFLALIDIQRSLAENLQVQTSAVLEQTQWLRSETRTTVNNLADKTVQDLERYRLVLLVISTLVLLGLGLVSYWLVYRKTVLPLVGITRQLDDVGKADFPDQARHYFLAELSTLAAAVKDLDIAHKKMQAQDELMQGVNRDLLQANEDLGQFAHVASHDLQEPLRKLQQFSDLLVEDYHDILDDEGKFFLDTIRTSAKRMSVLIQETLAYSRAGSGNQALEAVNLSELNLQLRDEMDLVVRESKAVIHIESLPIVNANKVGMAQLFRNLMLNALKYRKPDVAAQIHIAARVVTDAKEMPHGMVCITVQDNGVGIDDKYLERIFTPFERLHSGKVQGTGLGLAICRKVCDSHGWLLTVTSSLGVGTIFEISIPQSHLVKD